jgi:hypothetical protein
MCRKAHRSASIIFFQPSKEKKSIYHYSEGQGVLFNDDAGFRGFGNSDTDRCETVVNKNG